MNFVRQITAISHGLSRRAKRYLARVASATRSRFKNTTIGPTEPVDLDVIPAQADHITLVGGEGDRRLKSDTDGNELRLNNTAVKLWQLCDGRKTVREIAALLAWRFQEDERRVQEDILAALPQFEANGFVYRSAPDFAEKAPSSRRSRAKPKVFGVGWPFGPHTSSNSVRKPINFDWTNNRDEATVPLTVCIGHGVREGVDVPGKKIAWLLESPAIAELQGLYDFVRENQEKVLEAYDLILSSDRAFCQLDPKIKYHISGSNLPWMAEDKYRIYPKTKLCSMIASAKQMVEGHRIRLDYAEKFKDRLDLYGGACGSPKVTSEDYILDKSDGLAPYMFSVAMENCRVSLYYTEKITDCFVTGTVPIYWGSDDIGEIFDAEGIIKLDDEFDVGSLSSDLYADMMPHIRNNFEIASSLEGADDALFAKYIKT